MLKKLRRRLTVIFTALTGSILAAVIGVSLWFSLAQAKQNAMDQFINNLSFIGSNLPSASQNAAWLTDTEKANQYLIKATRNSEDISFAPGWGTAENRELLTGQAIELLDNTAVATITLTGNGLAEAFTVANIETIYTAADSAIVEDNPAIFSQEIPVNVTINSAVEAQPAQVVFYGSAMQTTTPSAPYTELEVNDQTYRMSYLDLWDDGSYYELMVIQDMSVLNGQLALVWAGFLTLLAGGLALLVIINWLLAKMVLKPTAKSIQQQAEFVAAASHELRSPLAVVRSSLSAVEVAEDEAQAAKYRKAASAEAERMTRLVDDLLLLAGGDAGNWRMDAATVDMDTLLIETAEQYTPLAKKQKQTLLLRLPDDTLGEVKGDADRLRQILSVLLDNALQHAPSGTGVILTAACKKNRLEIEVIDHGQGVADEDKERVFERFYRADKSRTGKKHFGLGLSVAKELAELHKGSLSVSDTAGGGATFRLVLPLEAKKPPKPAEDDKADRAT